MDTEWSEKALLNPFRNPNKLYSVPHMIPD